MTPTTTAATAQEQIERLEALVVAQARILDLVGDDAPLDQVLHELASLFQAQIPGSIASIRLATHDGTALVGSAAPNLDAKYRAATDPLPIAEGSASCGTAAWRREAVFVHDIATDPKWDLVRAVALAAGLRACWSVPVIGSEGRVLGTFAAYWPWVATPSEHDLWVQRQFGRLTQVAIERSQIIDRVTEVLASERRRIAGAIHDDPIQVMTGAALRLQRLAAIATPEQKLLLDETQQAVNSSVERLRHLLFELHPPELEEDGIVLAVEAYLEQTLDPAQIAWHVDGDIGLDPPLAVSSLLYRLTREAVANIVKHSGATRVDVSVGGINDGIQIQIADNGCGFDAARVQTHAPGHIGMTNSRFLARRAAGRWQITSQPDHGTVVEFWLPAQATAGVKS